MTHCVVSPVTPETRRQAGLNPLLTLSATRLAAMIRDRNVTSREVVETHIARIERVNPPLNAVVRDRFDRAREEARRADERARRGEDDLGPLHGVPCTIKESFALEGMPNSSGLVARRDVRAARDATAVARLRAAGAIPLGVTNVPELCMWMETNNRVYGRTNNPYDTRRIAGGSSGGEGGIIGAGGSPFGLGADIAGSIRMPAFFNGIFGHKPTGGRVPNTGQYPIAENEALRYLTTGPLTRRAEDLHTLLQVLSGPDGEDTGCRAMPLRDPGLVRLSELTTFDVEDNGAHKVTPDLREAQRRAAEHLGRAGATVRPAAIARLRKSFDIFSSMLAVTGMTPYGTLIGNGRPIRCLCEILRWMFGRSQHTLPAIGLAMLEKLPAMLPARTRRFVEEGIALREEIDRLLGDRGVMLFPSYPEPAPLHNRPILRPFKLAYTAIVNVMELPATQVPLGLNEDGLPLGVQVVAARGNDPLTIAVALELERAFGGWVPPPGLTEEPVRRVHPEGIPR